MRKINNRRNNQLKKKKNCIIQHNNNSEIKKLETKNNKQIICGYKRKDV